MHCRRRSHLHCPAVACTASNEGDAPSPSSVPATMSHVAPLVRATMANAYRVCLMSKGTSQSVRNSNATRSFGRQAMLASPRGGFFHIDMPKCRLLKARSISLSALTAPASSPLLNSWIRLTVAPHGSSSVSLLRRPSDLGLNPMVSRPYVRLYQPPSNRSSFRRRW